jgi:hypothetical protein
MQLVTLGYTFQRVLVAAVVVELGAMQGTYVEQHLGHKTGQAGLQ